MLLQSFQSRGGIISDLCRSQSLGTSHSTVCCTILSVERCSLGNTSLHRDEMTPPLQEYSSVLYYTILYYTKHFAWLQQYQARYNYVVYYILTAYVCQFQNGKILFCSSTGVQMSSQNIHSIFGPSYLFEGLGVYPLMWQSFSGLSLHLSIPLQFCHNVITTLTILIPYFSASYFSQNLIPASLPLVTILIPISNHNNITNSLWLSPFCDKLITSLLWLCHYLVLLPFYVIWIILMSLIHHLSVGHNKNIMSRRDMIIPLLL